MCPQKGIDPEANAVRRRDDPQKKILIGSLSDLDPYADRILESLNADKRLLLLAAVDAPGVLRDMGYELSPLAARELRHSLPKMSREQRGRYVAWVRDTEDISKTIDIRLVKQKSGHGLLEKTGGIHPRADTADESPGKNTGGFDVVAQFGEAFCNRMLRRDYAFGHLPRSVYRINNGLNYFSGSGEYDGLASSLGSADRVLHFYLPTLTFPMSQADTPRVTSAFVADGFGSQEIQGTATVDAKLSVRKDSKGQPKYVEISFDKLTAADVTIKLTAGSPTAAASAELSKMVLDALKGFSKSATVVPGIPITFTLVDSAGLSGMGTLAKINVSTGIRKPDGASEPLLMVGAERATNAGSGDLDSVPCAIKTGADFAIVQDSAWLTKKLNDAVSASMPIYYDPDTGKIDPNGNLRVDSINWRYREGGLSGHVDATREDFTPGINISLPDFQIHMDILFHSSEPTIDCCTGHDGLPEMECWRKILFVTGMALLGAMVGWLFGYFIGLGLGAAALGEYIGYGIGGLGGLFTGYALVGWEIQSFDVSGVKFEKLSDETQSIKITQTYALPETDGYVKVVPNDFIVSEQGTLMSAKIIGPNYTEAKPSVKIKGTFSADISLADYETPSKIASTANTGQDAGTGLTAADASKGNALTQNRPAKYYLGTITLDYAVISTSGLQGKLAHLWSFNGTPIGTDSSVSVEVPVTAGMLAGFEYNKVNLLGVISVTVTDSFGRIGSAVENITVGNPANLQPFAPAVMETRGYVDPIERVGMREYGDPASIVGWRMEGDLAASQLGALKSLTTVNLNGKNYAIVGTQKV